MARSGNSAKCIICGNPAAKHWAETQTTLPNFDVQEFDCPSCGRFVFHFSVVEQLNDLSSQDRFKVACVIHERRLREGTTGLCLIVDRTSAGGTGELQKQVTRVWHIDELLADFPKGHELIDRALMNLARLIEDGHPMQPISQKSFDLPLLLFCPKSDLNQQIRFMHGAGFVSTCGIFQSELTITITPQGWKRVTELKEAPSYPERYWHCRVRKKKHKEVARVSDLTFAELQKRVVTPFGGGKKFFVDGQVFDPEDVAEIKIVRTPQNDKLNEERFHQERERQNRNSPFAVLGTYQGPFEANDAADYTRELLFSGDSIEDSPPSAEGKDAEMANVFVVHGHDDGARAEVCRTIESLDLEPIVLSEQTDMGRTVIEKFEKHSEGAAYAVVLLTPDDEGRLMGEKDLHPRARQNVVLELGYFYAKLGRANVCALVKGNLELPSDISGVIHKKIENGNSWKYELAREMQAAGLPVDLNKVK